MVVINAKEQARQKFENGLTRESRVYKDLSRDALKNTGASEVYGSQPFKVSSAKWNGSEGHYKLWNQLHEMQGKFKNSATAPSPADLATYFQLLFIDVQRQMDDRLDLQPIIANVVNDESLQEINYLRDWLPFIGKEKIISGANDKVPLIDQKAAVTDAVTLYIKAFGWKDSLKNTVFNPINLIQRVTEAAANIGTDGKNNDLMGIISSATYGAKHAQAADSTGATFDLKVFNTLRQAYKTLGKLKHPMYTNKLVSSLSGYSADTVLLCHPSNLWDIQRVVSGITGGGFQQNMGALPIGSVVPYAGGIMDGETWGEETLSLPGVAVDTAYLLIPGQANVLTKRDVTLETGTGSVLECSTEERSWHRISGVHTDYLIGGAATNTGKGCIVKIALPTE